MESIIFVNKSTKPDDLADQTVDALRNGTADPVAWVGSHHVAWKMQAAAVRVAREVPEATSIGSEKYPPVIAEALGCKGAEQANMTWLMRRLRGKETAGVTWWG